MRTAVMPTSITTRSTIRVAMDVLRSTFSAVPARSAHDRCILVPVVLLLLAATTALSAASSDRPPSGGGVQLERDPSGEGYRLSGAGLWLAGDATVNAVVPEKGRPFATLEDVAVLVRADPTPRLSLFSEARLENTFTLESGHGFKTGSADLSIERLYADVLLTPHLTLRVGKMLTPFGLWNVIRRAPLSWTVERPPVTEQTFPEHATGLDVTYQTTWHGWSFDATGYGPAQDKLAFHPSNDTGLLGGGRFATGHSLGPAFAALGLDGATFEDAPTGRWAQTYGTDLEIDVFGHQLTSEFAYERLRGPRVSDQSGLYVQDAMPIASGLYAVMRFDFFRARRGPDETGGLLGVFWHPLPHLIVKLDYQFADRQTDNLNPGLLAAVSLFF